MYTAGDSKVTTTCCEDKGETGYQRAPRGGDCSPGQPGGSGNSWSQTPKEMSASFAHSSIHSSIHSLIQRGPVTPPCASDKFPSPGRQSRRPRISGTLPSVTPPAAQSQSPSPACSWLTAAPARSWKLRSVESGSCGGVCVRACARECAGGNGPLPGGHFLCGWPPSCGDARCLSRTLPLERPLGSQRVLGKCPSGPHPMAPHGPPSPGPPPGEEGEQHSPAEGPLGDHRRESLWGGGAAISSVTQETDMSQ